MNESNGLNPLEKFHQAVEAKSSLAAGFTSTIAQHKFCYFFHLQEKSKAKKKSFPK
jgi:hypothetical protein